MPIYAYRCEACGFAKDVLQKVSDPQLTVCLSCGAPQFRKQVTAAGFQLKGTGWYATDFKNGAGTTAPAVSAPAATGKEGGDNAGKATGDNAGAAGGSNSSNNSNNSNTGSTTATAAPASPPTAAS